MLRSISNPRIGPTYHLDRISGKLEHQRQDGAANQSCQSVVGISVSEPHSLWNLLNEIIAQKLETICQARGVGRGRQSMRTCHRRELAEPDTKQDTMKLDPQATITPQQALVSNYLLKIKDNRQNLQAKKVPG